MKSETEIKEILEKNLSRKRFLHSLAVSDEAVRLAKAYGADCEKARLAGLVHDACKDMPANILLQMASEFGILIGEIEKAAPKLLHALIGAEYIKRAFGIVDEDVVRAVRYHTTARAGMTLLEKVLYLADFTSADRDYDGVDDMRRAVDVDMDSAMREALRFTVSELAAKSGPIHPDTIAAYNEIMLKNSKG